MGWLDDGSNDIAMVQHHRVFDVQFGSPAERHRGETVRLRLVPEDSRVWTAFARDNGPDAPVRYTNIYDSQQLVRSTGAEAVSVILSAAPHGDYRGWIKTGSSNPSMVQHERFFDMQFTGGHREEERSGKGQAVGLLLYAGN